MSSQFVMPSISAELKYQKSHAHKHNWVLGIISELVYGSVRKLFCRFLLLGCPVDFVAKKLVKQSFVMLDADVATGMGFICARGKFSHPNFLKSWLVYCYSLLLCIETTVGQPRSKCEEAYRRWGWF